MFVVVPESKFRLGFLAATANAVATLNALDIQKALFRHSMGDWGELEAEDRATNELALQEGGRLVSSYRDLNATVFWIITEADRSATTVLLPEDY